MPIVCFDPTTLARTDAYKYTTLTEANDDFGEDHVFRVADGLIACYEEEREGHREPGLALLVADARAVPGDGTLEERVKAAIASWTGGPY